MNDDTINDLKQFISANVHQEVTGIVGESEGRLQKKISDLDKKIDDRTEEILDAIGDTLGNRVETVEEDVKQSIQELRS